MSTEAQAIHEFISIIFLPNAPFKRSLSLSLFSLKSKNNVPGRMEDHFEHIIYSIQRTFERGGVLLSFLFTVGSFLFHFFSSYGCDCLYMRKLHVFNFNRNDLYEEESGRSVRKPTNNKWTHVKSGTVEDSKTRSRPLDIEKLLYDNMYVLYVHKSHIFHLFNCLSSIRFYFLACWCTLLQTVWGKTFRANEEVSNFQQTLMMLKLLLYAIFDKFQKFKLQPSHIFTKINLQRENNYFVSFIA